MASTVGPQTLPLASEGQGEDLADPVAEAIADFIAWSLNYDLSAKLADLPGTGTVALPSGHVFTIDPMAKQGQRVKRPVPSLFVWWSGVESVTPWTVFQDQSLKTYNLLYVFRELPDKASTIDRSGVLAAVSRSIAYAAQAGGHPSYSYNSKPAGTMLIDSIGTLGVKDWSWRYDGGQAIQRIGIDDPNTRSLGDHKSGRDYPAFAARFTVRELVGRAEATDWTNDSLATVKNNGVEILQRYSEGIDGDESL